MTAIRVLIVDDNPRVRQDLRTLLPLLCEVQIVGEASDGAEAVLQAETLHPDVVLLDLELPEMDGYEAGRRIKARQPTTRVVALTAHSYPAARERARRAGLDGFVEKGAPVDAIIQAIQGSEPGN